MKLQSIAMAVLLAAMAAALAHAQEVPPQENEDAPPPTRNAWVARLIVALNNGMDFEAWRGKEVMRLRIEMEIAAPLPEERELEEGALRAARVQGTTMRGFVTYDLVKRRMRLDLEDRFTYLISRDEVAVWTRGRQQPPLLRDDVADESLNAARAMYYLLALPLWINDPAGSFVPGGLQEVKDEPHYVGVYVVKDAKPEREKDTDADDEAEAGDAADAAEDKAVQRRTYPDDWFAFFTRTHVPHRIDAVAYLVHDKSRPLTELPRARLAFFDNYEKERGVMIPRSWRIHEFSRADGVGTRIGSASVDEVEFGPQEDELFELPERALRVR